MDTANWEPLTRKRPWRINSPRARSAPPSPSAAASHWRPQVEGGWQCSKCRPAPQGAEQSWEGQRQTKSIGHAHLSRHIPEDHTPRGSVCKPRPPCPPSAPSPHRQTRCTTKPLVATENLPLLIPCLVSQSYAWAERRLRNSVRFF